MALLKFMTIDATGGAPALTGSLTVDSSSGVVAVADDLDIQSQLSLSGTVTPPTVGTAQNDYNPAGLATVSAIRQDLSASTAFTGLAGGANGRILSILNISATHTLTLLNDDAASTAANRFALPDATGCVIDPGGTLTLRYDGTSSRWRTADQPKEALTATEHEKLLQLIHFIDEGPANGFTTGATKTVTGGAFPTEILWKRADTTALVRQTLVYTDVYPTTVTWRIYAENGITILGTVTDTIVYDGPFEASRTRSIT